MNQGQELFCNFILERVRDEEKDTAKILLDESLAKLSDDTFTHDDALEAQKTIMKMLKPEALGEVIAAMTQIAAQMKK